MMTLSRETLYKFHVANYRGVADAMERVARQTRIAIRLQDDRTTTALTKTFALLFAGKLEARLGKLLYERSGFTAAQRATIQSQPSQAESWNAAIELGFRKAYKIRGAINQRAIPHSAYTRYETLVELIDDQFRPIFELRNKLAHGQWVHPLAASGLDVSVPQLKALQDENILTLQIKDSVAEYACRLINDLIVSAPTFERDFDRNFSGLYEVLLALRQADYTTYVAGLIRSHEEGKRRRSLASAATGSE